MTMRPKKTGLFSFLLGHMLAGVCGGFLLGALLLYFDIGGLWSMLSKSKDAWLLGALFFFGLFITFGSLGMGYGIFGLSQETDDDKAPMP